MTQFLWSKKVRQNLLLLFIISQIVSVGMWLERFVIIVGSLGRLFLPSSWNMYYPTIWDWMTFAGTLGLFTFLMFGFVRVLPMVTIFEVKELLYRIRHTLHLGNTYAPAHAGNGHGHNGHGGEGGSKIYDAEPVGRPAADLEE